MAKKMKFLYIFKKDKQKEIPLTYVKDVKQAKEYLYKYYLNLHLDHFNLWCDCHNRPNKSWEDYCYYAHEVLEIHTNPDDIQIVPIWFTQDDIASILRSILGNNPIGATYETIEEKMFFQELKNNNLTS